MESLKGAAAMSVNIYDVARCAQVSSATVSRVLNGSPHVREATRKRGLPTPTKKKKITHTHHTKNTVREILEILAF